MLNAAETRDLEHAARVLRAAAAAAFSLGMDEDHVYALVEVGIDDARDWPVTAEMQGRNAARVRPDGADRYADRPAA